MRASEQATNAQKRLPSIAMLSYFIFDYYLFCYPKTAIQRVAEFVSDDKFSWTDNWKNRYNAFYI